MSTKTLKKRIAVVAVSALTAGFLSVASAPVANAGAGDAITAPDIFVAAAASAGSAEAIGQCAISSTALQASISTVNSTGTVLAVGAVIKFTTTTNGEGQLRVTGPAKLSLGTNAPNTSTISQDAKAVGFEAIGAEMAKLEVTGAGDIVVTAYNNLTIGSGTSVKTFSITGVDTCASGATPVAANSFFTLRNNADEGGSATDDVMAAGDLKYSQKQYIAVELKNQYKSDLTGSAGLLTAEGTGNVLVGVNQDGSTNVGFGTTAATVANAIDIFVAQNTTLAPGAPLTTTVTIKYNGVTLATKTLTFHGIGTSIVVDPADVTVGSSGGTGAFKFLVKDAAGNNLNTGLAGSTTPAFGSFTAAAAGFVSAGIVLSATGTADSSGSTKATGTFACTSEASAPVSSGTQSVTIGAIIGTTLIKSNAFTARCGAPNIRAFTASMDKVTYSPGEIATLTLGATDRHAAIVGDTATVGTAFNQISIPGMTIIGSAISSGDAFTNGVKTYKFRVDQNEGSFVAQAQVSVHADAATAEKSVKTIQYTIKASGSTVTNAEVLKSIVAL
ncbi:MAG: hypothetical protein EBU08_17975, partial [Micrococcales bacterium]|nr:hypothetical protein [Micrococcales bacterium]